jgi:hypothetical protein
MKPGDVIEFVYESDGSVVHTDETMWPTPMNAYVPIGGRSLVVSVESTADKQPALFF